MVKAHIRVITRTRRWGRGGAALGEVGREHVGRIVAPWGVGRTAARTHRASTRGALAAAHGPNAELGQIGDILDGCIWRRVHHGNPVQAVKWVHRLWPGTTATVARRRASSSRSPLDEGGGSLQRPVNRTIQSTRQVLRTESDGVILASVSVIGGSKSGAEWEDCKAHQRRKRRWKRANIPYTRRCRC